MAENSSIPTSPKLKNTMATSRTKTTLSLAHPPPAVKHRQRFNIRPRLLLQLHELSTASRPVPVLDVLPSVVFAPKIAVKCPRLFKGKDGLGPNDLIIAISQDYDTQQDRDGHGREDEHDGAKEPLAVVCQNNGKTENQEHSAKIRFSDGRSCDISVNQNGRYNLTIVDLNSVRTTARWVPRHKQRTKAQIDSVTAPQDAKHTFSLIDPTTRRHPIIASLSRHTLEIHNQYSVLEPQVSPQSPPSSGESPGSILEDDGSYFKGSWSNDDGRGFIEVDEDLRTLITVSAIWVAFEEGYSPYWKASSVSSPTMSEPRSPPFDKNQDSFTAPVQSPRTNFSPEKKQRKTTAVRLSWGQQQGGASQATKESPSRQRAHTTGHSFLCRCSNRNVGANERPSTSGGLLTRELGQPLPQKEQGINVSLIEKSNRSAAATEPLRCTTNRRDSKHSSFSRRLLPAKCRK